MIARHRKDRLSANLLAVLPTPHLAPDAEIPKEIEDVTGLNRRVETFEDRLIHLLDVSKRSITKADFSLLIASLLLLLDLCVTYPRYLQGVAVLD